MDRSLNFMFKNCPSNRNNNHQFQLRPVEETVLHYFFDRNSTGAKNSLERSMRAFLLFRSQRPSKEN